MAAPGSFLCIFFCAFSVWFLSGFCRVFVVLLFVFCSCFLVAILSQSYGFSRRFSSNTKYRSCTDIPLDLNALRPALL